MSQKEIHKESLERLKVQSTVTKGWFTKWDIGKMEGADPSLPMFDELCTAACEGLQEGDHEVAAWAKKGLKQYYYEKTGPVKEKQSNESLTKAEQRLQMDDPELFRKGEKALMANQGPQQLVFGESSKRAEPAKAITDSSEEQYKKTHLSLTRAVKAFGSAVEKVVFLKEALKSKEGDHPSQQMAASLQALTDLEQRGESGKARWVTEVTRHPACLPADSQELAQKIQDLQNLKEQVEQEQKDLNKDVNPHKLWAKNSNLV
eukprot:Skav231683  [mRNA]  locus=scaffold597:768516:769298:- [translate_table: standard]